MQLQSLVGPEISTAAAVGPVDILGITADSRQVKPGWLFAAIPGAKADGTSFVPEAIAKGASAILAKMGADVAVPPGVVVLTAAEPRRALALMAARFYPAQPATVVAVTGTSGKTSVAEFTRQVFAALGHASASLGTIGLVKPDGSVYGGLTTPDPVSLHKTLAELAGEGVTHLSFEASSHGLDQHRLDGVQAEGCSLHQPRPRSPRLSPDHGGLSRGQAAAVHGAAARGRRCRRQRGCRARPAGDRRRQGRGPLRAHRRHEGRNAAARLGDARRVRAAPAHRARGQGVRHPPAADRHLSGRQRAARGRARHCRRGERSPRAARARGPRRRQGPPRGGGQRARRPDRHRLRAQARRAARRACRVAAVRAGPAQSRVRLRRRPRQGQAPHHGADRGSSTPTTSSSPTTTRAARARPPSAPRSWPARPAHARSATGPRPSAPACGCSAMATCC